MQNDPLKHRLPPFTRNGIILVNKPSGWTSHDVVAFMRARFNIPKAGHCGTLDPAATGLLVIVIGKFTKLSQKFSCEDKIYGGTILLGTETDSQDMDGTVTRTADYSGVTEERLRAAFAKFTGEIMQTPPMVSAVKKDGERLYKLARKGVEVEREAKPVTVYSVDLANFNPPYADFVVRCSKGTYIRTLCADVGAELGCGAALYRLNRIQSGEFELKDAYGVEEMKEWSQKDLADRMDDYLHRKLAKMVRFTSF